MTPRGCDARSPARSVVITTSYPAGPDDPSGHFVAAEVKRLRQSGASVTVLAPRAGAARASDPQVQFLPAGDAFGWPGALARLRERPLRAFGILRFVLAARRELARLDDVEHVVAHFILPCAWPIATRRTPPRFEAVAHGSDVRLLERLPRCLRRLVAGRLAGADVRCASEELRARLERALGPVRRARFSVAPPPLDLGASPTRTAAREELGIAKAARLFVVMGRLVPSKRVDVALRALTLIPHAMGVVVGDGPERARLERMFPEVRFVGRVPRGRALSWLAAADVVVSASLLEGAPSVVREARALATRVVARPAGDLDVWSRDDPGLWVVGGLSCGA